MWRWTGKEKKEKEVVLEELETEKREVCEGFRN